MPASATFDNAELFEKIKKVNGKDEGYVLSSVADLKAHPSPSWLIVDLLPARGLCVLYGEPGSGKSFLALDIAAHLARRQRWAGRRVRKAKVVYIGLEGHLRERIAAYEEHHGIEDADLADLLVMQGQPLDLLKDDTVPALIASIRRHLGIYRGPLVVIIDTLARSMPGGNENTSDDMGKVIAAAAEIERHLNALVQLIHHGGKDATKGARGWSGLRGAADCEIEVKRDGDIRRATFAKVKDGLDGTAVEFRLDVIDLGPRRDIDPEADPEERITSCVAVVTNDNAAPKASNVPFGKNQKLLYTALRNGGPMLRHECLEFLKKANVARSSRHDVINGLLATGVVEDTVAGLRIKQ